VTGAPRDHPRVRATDRRRERAVSALGDGFAAGAIGPDTLGFRLDAAYRARTVAELRPLTADLPLRGLRDVLERVRVRLSPPPGRPTVRIAPPPDGPGPWVIGRSPRCRLAIHADTVSRAHAELRRTDAGWEIRDLGSTNGTWVNGWRVQRAVLPPGDDLLLGEVRVRLDA
jgi:pSer/pThr/pTyr-binding forkhead associated (FHA) protein